MMRKEFFLLMILLGFSVISCIPNRDLIYLQNKSNDTLSVSVNAMANKPYRIQTGDILSIRIKALDQKLVEIFSNSENQNVNPTEQSLFFEGYSVDDHGNIRVPVLGEVNVLGYTADEIRVKIEKQLLDEYFKKEANIFVLVKLSGLRYTINGEVLSPGSKTIFRESATIMDAVANGGDIKMTGNRKDVVIIRQYPHGTETHTIDLTDVKSMKSPYYYLQPNDYIYVKPLKQKSWGTGETGTQSVATIITALSLITTTFLLLKNI